MKRLRTPFLLSWAFLLLAIVYAGWFNTSIRTDRDAATTRFYELADKGALRRAAPHGERAIGLAIKDGADANMLAPLKARVAEAEFARRKYRRAADLLLDALSADWGQHLPERERIELEDRHAQAYLAAGKIEEAVSIYASFLELAGDAAAAPENADPIALAYSQKLNGAAAAFKGAVNHAAPHEIEGATEQHILASAAQFADLGGYYALTHGNEYAAAGLLVASYEARKKIEGGDHQDTVQLTLILGPLYARMNRLKDAENLYLDAFHAQERVKGSNSPDLSLYIKLLAGIYERQERYTEAQALYEHLRSLFRDAFGAQRYAINRNIDRRENINRPVSQYFPLEADYSPDDLVSAAAFYVPTAKAENIDEMKLRLAPDPETDAREANLPARLAQLISLCGSETGDSVSLRSGYRAYKTQAVLFERIGEKGTVTPPGMSEHQTGLAADINVNGRFMRQSDRAYQCFEENAFRFGFILSYPPANDYLPGADSFEPWHWRYVGVQTAQLYREAGPHDKPQEFLAALPCYQERAANGVFPNAGEADICLRETPLKVASASAVNDSVQPERELPDSARILNNQASAPVKR